MKAITVCRAYVYIDRIRGSDPETDLFEPAPTHKSWLVNTDIASGSRRTIVTGARYVYDLPFPPKRSVHDFRDLGPSDDAWCYPNEEDIIGEFTIVIQSFRPIRPPKDGDMLLVDRSDPKQEARRPEKPSLHTPDQDSTAPYVLVAKWGQVMPGQTVELRLSRDEVGPNTTPKGTPSSQSHPAAQQHMH